MLGSIYRSAARNELKQRKINKRKKHVLKSRVHLDNLNKLHENFVLVPADKASNNVIVIRNKYYLDVVINPLTGVGAFLHHVRLH